MGGDLIDTTEMYLKTIYELEEDNIAPMRARIVERIGHSGPTVSQTVARMERDGLVEVGKDRHLLLTDEGRRIAIQVIRKHRLAELLLLHVVGLELSQIHGEACRWEHVMSDEVDLHLQKILQSTEHDPFGNLIPSDAEGAAVLPQPGIPFEDYVSEGNPTEGTVVRLGEPIQSDPELLQALVDVEMLPGTQVKIERRDGLYEIKGPKGTLPVSDSLSRHLFMADK